MEVGAQCARVQSALPVLTQQGCKYDGRTLYIDVNMLLAILQSVGIMQHVYTCQVSSYTTTTHALR